MRHCVIYNILLFIHNTINIIILPLQFREKKELKTRIFDESVLSTEQLDFLGSVRFDNYITKGNNFLKQVYAVIQKHKDFDNMILQRHNVVQKKIAQEVFKNITSNT